MRHRNIILISFMSLLLIGFSGCSSSEQEKGSHLHVLTELEYREKSGRRSFLYKTERSEDNN